MASKDKHIFCSKCGYTGPSTPKETCPQCGRSFRPKKIALGRSVKPIIGMVIVLLIIGIAYFCYSNESIATEFRQMRQPRPNSFYVGVDVSATISSDILNKLKDNLVDRLRQFIGDPSVSYGVTTFGNPGCAERSFKRLVQLQSPDDESAFAWKVEDKIQTIENSKVSPRDTSPLTTPLNCFLQTELPKLTGKRVIIFSDLMNDDSDCAEQFMFPEEPFIEFGKNPNGQIIFLYPTPRLTDNASLNARTAEKQQAFIDRVMTLSNKGQLRAFFYHIPDEPLKRLSFIRSQLQTAIPTTTFDVVWERTTRLMHTMVSAVRG